MRASTLISKSNQGRFFRAAVVAFKHLDYLDWIMKTGTKTRTLTGSICDNDNNLEISMMAGLQWKSIYRGSFFFSQCLISNIKYLAGGVTVYQKLLERKTLNMWAWRGSLSCNEIKNIIESSDALHCVSVCCVLYISYHVWISFTSSVPGPAVVNVTGPTFYENRTDLVSKIKARRNKCRKRQKVQVCILVIMYNKIIVIL